MKTLKFTTATGMQIEIRAEYTANLYNVTKRNIMDELYVSDEQAVKQDSKLEIYVNGTRIEQLNSQYGWGGWEIITPFGQPDNVKMIKGCERVAFANPADIKKVEEFLTEVVAEGTPEEVIEHREGIENKKKAVRIKEAEEVVAAAETQDSIPTERAYRAWAKEYNDIHNEGGDGYVPQLITKEQYEAARAELSK